MSTPEKTGEEPSLALQYVKQQVQKDMEPLYKAFGEQDGEEYPAFNLDDDTPLPPSSCPVEGPCEGCQ